MRTSICLVCDQVAALVEEQTQKLQQLRKYSQQRELLRDRIDDFDPVLARHALRELQRVEEHVKRLEAFLDDINSELSVLRAYHLHCQHSERQPLLTSAFS